MECYARGFVAVVPCGVRSTCTAVASVDFPCPDIPRTRATSTTLVLTLPMWPLLGKMSENSADGFGYPQMEINTTPPENERMSPEKGRFQKEIISLPTSSNHHFSGDMLVFRV